MRHLVFAAVAAVFLFGGPSAADKRVALIIGNSAYEHVSNLPNPINDATDISLALKRLDFEVTTHQDLDFTAMRLALRDFGETAAEADIALIYFAGHGIEIDKQNYLIPVNAELKSDRDVEFEAIRLDAVIGSLSDAKGVRIVLLDACRNNPFVADMVRTTATRSIGRGLARIDPGGVLVGYAARGGTIALDGDGRNSPYAKALLAHVEEPGLEIGKLFRRVRDTVLEQTDGFQEPFTYGSLPGDDIFLAPPVELAAVLPAPAEASQMEQMLEEFAMAEKYNTLRRWTSFVERFGDQSENQLVGIAVARKEELEQERDRHTRSANRAPIMQPDFDENGRAKLTREEGRLLQEALSYLGHYSGPIDGAVGPMTRQAISAARFQTALPPGTHVDVALLRRLPDVQAIESLQGDKAQFYDPANLPIGLEPRLEKALRIYGEQPREAVKFGYFRGHLYLAVAAPHGSFETANKRAQQAGGHLVTIQDAAENQFLVDLFSNDDRFVHKDSSGSLFGPMIGLFQAPGSTEPKGGWTWITGEPLNYTAWSSWSPNNYNGRQHRARFHLNRNFVRPGSVPKFWDDASNHIWKTGYLVEVE